MTVPQWALKKVGPEDRQITETSFRKGMAKVVFSDRKALRKWTKYRNWKTSWFFLETSFFKKLFEKATKTFSLCKSNMPPLPKIAF